ncbi:hypothetical protein DL96DRAFT_1684350 [Flagelloscypha sp. PMI_526]|nr:hypothetical protein DL96DRAFT_1684350 [Flagelloscypha sp. PMI_526]
MHLRLDPPFTGTSTSQGKEKARKTRCSSRVVAALALVTVLPLISALSLQTPSSAKAGGSLTVRWSSSPSDPTSFNMVLVNYEITKAWALTVNTQTSAGSVSVGIPSDAPDGDQYRIQATTDHPLTETGDFTVGEPKQTTKAPTTPAATHEATTKHTSTTHRDPDTTSSSSSTHTTSTTTHESTTSTSSLTNSTSTPSLDSIPSVTSSAAESTSALPAGSPSALSRALSSKPPTGPIVGGVIGGFAFLLLLAIATWFILHRRNQRQSPSFENEEEPPSDLTKDPYTHTTQIQGPFNSITTAARQKQALVDPHPAHPDFAAREERLAELEAEISQLRGQQRLSQLEEEARQLRAEGVNLPAYH